MALDFADLENSIEDDAEEPEVELEEGAEPEDTEDPGDSGGPEGLEDLDADDPELEDEAKFKIGDELVTGKELKAERLRQADYTRKTQQLSEDRKAFETERGALSEENEELKSWVSSLKDPEEMAFELARYFPDAFEGLRAAIIQQAIEEQDMTPTELAAVKRARVAEHAEKARQKDQALEERKATRREQEQKTVELRHTFNDWLKETMKEVGLDPENPKHQKFVRKEISTEHKGKTWTKDTFKEACKEVAGLLSVKPVKPKASLPPSGTNGRKAPSERRSEPKERKIVHTEDFFKNLRAGR